MNIKDYLEQKRIAVDRFLDDVSPPAATPPTTLHESMRYSLMAGGKRVRPILTIAAAEALGTTPPGLMAVACSLEFIHTYSLIHDDLPAMDDDDLRRGKPTVHKAFDEPALHQRVDQRHRPPGEGRQHQKQGDHESEGKPHRTRTVEEGLLPQGVTAPLPTRIPQSKVDPEAGRRFPGPSPAASPRPAARLSCRNQRLMTAASSRR